MTDHYYNYKIMWSGKITEYYNCPTEEEREKGRIRHELLQKEREAYQNWNPIINISRLFK